MPQFDIRTAEHVVLPRELLMLAALLRNGRFGLGHTGAGPATQLATTPAAEKKEQVLVTVMNEQIKQAIRTRASSARSQAEVADAIFSTLREYRIDMKHVSLEEMKSAVVEATRASREEGNENGSLPV
jgi:hypothetical protein